MAKMVKCPECGGSGMSSCDLDYGEWPHPAGCPACAGSGRAICSECQGTGEVEDYD
ncbi:hypothetical protein [Moraxella oblonga]|uniref:hypothetical protein n=1 Tax=Moraxella oblonga TaxID=200413 RepID=UPI000AF94C8B|nr:hypothetical protein [Moraxella oblonga]